MHDTGVTVSRYRGVSKKKGKWEAKVMVNRKWAYRELFDSEEEAARAYDDAVWRLKPKEAKSYINFKERYSAERMRTAGKPRQSRQLLQRSSSFLILPVHQHYMFCKIQCHAGVIWPRVSLL